jgi:DNA-binding NarL/FixJ family response regulator
MTEVDPIRVVIVDDHPVVRQSLRFAMLTAQDVEVVGEAADSTEALRACGELHPDVVLMDLRLPGLDGIGTIRALQSQIQSQRQGSEPLPQVLVFTADLDEGLIAEALAAGACGYVPKEGEFGEILTAIRAAHARQQPQA